MLSRALKYKDTPYESKGLVYYYFDYDQKKWSTEYQLEYILSDRGFKIKLIVK